jgi:hypothetical protein
MHCLLAQMEARTVFNVADAFATSAGESRRSMAAMVAAPNGRSVLSWWNSITSPTFAFGMVSAAPYGCTSEEEVMTGE